MTDIEELVIDWYKARRIFFENGRTDELLRPLYDIEAKLEMFAISIISPKEYEKLKQQKIKIQ